ncbi:hypothetical protein FS837_005248, partial [Tulasnella sp. UAMH 9824]
MGETSTGYCASGNPSADMYVYNPLTMRTILNAHDLSIRVALALPGSRVALTDDAIRKRGGGLRATRSSHLYKGTSPPIDHLPHELLLEVFKLHVDLDTPVQSLVTLILVCKLWRNTVEDTPSLWRRISGREGSSSIQRALTLAKNAPLAITYRQSEARAIPTAFFAQIGYRIAQAKSLTINVGRIDHFPAILETISTTILETLDVVILLAQGRQANTVTLFGGKAASSTLKNFRVTHLPVALAPLRLSGLRSLGLSDIPITSADEVLRILMDSPALEDCSLTRLAFSKEFTPSKHLQRLLGSESNIAGANLRSIRLLHLRHLELWGLSGSFIHFLLSNMQALSLVSFRVQGEPHESPASELLTADISHLAPALKGPTAAAKKIQISSWDDKSWTLCIGKLIIDFQGIRINPRRHMEETLNWVYGHLGEHLKALPTSLLTLEYNAHLDLILWLGANLRVTNLELWTSGRSHRPRRIVSLLASPVAAMSNQWALPDLELLDTNVIDESGKWEILEMVKARHSFIQAQEDQGQRDVKLKSLKEIRLHAGGNN